MSDAMTETFESFRRIADEWTRAMEEAWKTIALHGYRPDECRLEHYEMRGETPFPDYRRVLVVADQPCFEVTSTWKKLSETSFACTTTPKLLAWPPDREP